MLYSRPLYLCSVVENIKKGPQVIIAESSSSRLAREERKREKGEKGRKRKRRGKKREKP